MFNIVRCRYVNFTMMAPYNTIEIQRRQNRLPDRVIP
jgi:hypothetical protein